MSSSTKIEKDKRVNDILLGPLERPALAFFARHMPRWVNSDMLTALGVVGSIVVLFSYIMVGQRGVIKGDWFLLLASLGFVLNWYGDSLDGTLARYRHEERPNYGYFLDHSIDGFTALCIFFGLGLSTLSDLGISMLALAFYLMLMISVTLKTRVRDDQHQAWPDRNPGDRHPI
jgi:phosphatidylglycerophosphate synthase